jgi:hypothetical protein
MSVVVTRLVIVCMRYDETDVTVNMKRTDRSQF